MTRDRLIEEATDVIWVERTKGGYRAATHMERMLAELRRLWAMEDELERLRRSTELRAAMRQDVADVRKLIRGGAERERPRCDSRNGAGHAG